MPLTLRNITHTLYDAQGVELASAIVIATLSSDEVDTTNKYVRINEQPVMQFTADGSGIATLTLADNFSKSSYKVDTYPAGTTEFVAANLLHSVNIRVAGSDAALTDILA